MRLAVLGLIHETNTFSSHQAGLDLYRDGGLQRGSEVVEVWGDSQATYAGFLEEGGDLDIDPLMTAFVTPCGRLTAEAYAQISQEMLDLLRAGGPYDGVLLGLHGAAAAVGIDEVDLHFARRVRECVGSAVPVGAVLDMHANVSPGLADVVDVLLAYQTNPHVDARARGRECRDLVVELVRGGARPSIVVAQLPLAVAITRQDTNKAPMSGLLEVAASIEREAGMVDASILEGFPYADVQQMGMAVIVTHRHGRAAAREAAGRLASAIWDSRSDLQGGAVSPEQALRSVAEGRVVGAERPALLLDVGDNIGAGGSGTSTHLLARAEEMGASRMAFTICDPSAVEQIWDAEAGSRIDVSVGGGSEYTGAHRLLGTVLRRSDGRYEEPRMAHGGLRYFDAGRTVAVRTDSDLVVVLCSKLVQPITPAQLTAAGVDIASLAAVVAKGVNGPRAGFEHVCSTVMEVDTPGVTSVDLSIFDYYRRRRPMFPFEPATAYDERSAS